MIHNKLKENVRPLNCCCFDFKNKLIHLLSFLWKKRLNYNVKILTPKKLGSLLMKIVLSVIYLCSKKLYYASLHYKDSKKNICSWILISKNFLEYICSHLKYNQYRIKSKTGISLEISKSIFKCLAVSVFSMKFLLRQKYLFCLFWLAPSVKLLWFHMCAFDSPQKKKRYTLLPDRTHAHIWHYIHQTMKPLSTIVFSCQDY